MFAVHQFILDLLSYPLRSLEIIIFCYDTISEFSFRHVKDYSLLNTAMATLNPKFLATLSDPKVLGAAILTLTDIALTTGVNGRFFFITNYCKTKLLHQTYGFMVLLV